MNNDNTAEMVVSVEEIAKTSKKIKEFKVITKNNNSIVFKLDNGKMEFENEDSINKFRKELSNLVENNFGTVKKITIN